MTRLVHIWPAAVLATVAWLSIGGQAFGIQKGPSVTPGSMPPGGHPPMVSPLPSNHPLAHPSSHPSALPSGTPSPELRKITPAEAKQLIRAFNAALVTERKALEHRQDFEQKELKASQKARLKEWQAAEAVKRAKYFEENPKGTERRAYMHDLIERRQAFIRMLDDERAERRRDQKVRLQSLKGEQEERLKEFQDYLGRGEEPPRRLWPAAGR